MSTPTVPAIVRAFAAEAAGATDLIANAFHALDISAWLVADPDQRRLALRDVFRIFVDHAVTHGLVFMTEDRAAVAVWFPHTEPIPEPPDYDQRLALACAQLTDHAGALDRFRTLDGFFEQHHPDKPHHYLAFLAVRSDRQGAGLGSALLHHHQAWLDRAGIPAYLEASSAGSRDLYARHGYRAAEPFYVPGGPPFWPMWREPRPSS
jgi:GNAT superfamily N-acetyltransferase